MTSTPSPTVTLPQSVNNSLNQTSFEISTWRPSYFSLIIIAYSVIMLVSLAGNSLVVAVVYRNENKRMRTVSNYFIVNMSCSDLLISICNIPMAINRLSSGDPAPVGGVLGNIFCKVSTLFFYLSIGVSLLSLVIITVDRFLLIFFPLKRFITAKVAGVLIGTIWLIGIIFTAPLAARMKLFEYMHLKVCYISSSMAVIQSYLIACLVIFVVVPLLTMLVLYSAIVMKLFRQIPPGENSAVNQEHSRRRNRKVLLMLVTITLLFVVCWVPHSSAYGYCVMISSTSSCLSVVYLQVLAFANGALNPCVYFIFNENFRVGFYRILRALCCPGFLDRVCCKTQVFAESSVNSLEINSLTLRNRQRALVINCK